MTSDSDKWLKLRWSKGKLFKIKSSQNGIWSKWNMVKMEYGQNGKWSK